MSYGKELVIDLQKCDSATFNRKSITEYFNQLCELINMKAADLYFWDFDGLPDEFAKAPPHLKGTSAVQFIETSSIVIHALDDLKEIYLNIFSCKEFDISLVQSFSESWFRGSTKSSQIITRG